jgi:hypothetical protein
MPFQTKHPKKHTKTLFPANKNKVRQLLHQTILFESLFSSRKDPALSLKRLHLQTCATQQNSDPLKVSLTGQSPI